MKKIICILVAALGALPVIAQVGSEGNYSNDVSRWVVDVNLLGGFATENFTAINPAANYPNALNVSDGNLKFKNGYSYGGDAQVGFFFGQKQHFGVGTGFMYLGQQGYAEIDNFHVEYQSTDYQGNVFRQSITSDKIQERIMANNLDIPVVLKYKTRFSKHWGFTADAGALINVMMQNNYKTNSSFDYEAIYQFEHSSDGGITTVYDNSPVPGNTDWLITKSQFIKNNPDGNVQAYFNSLRAQGYNVGLGVSPASTTGHVDYAVGSIGLIAQPAMSLYLSDNVALNFGVYYMYQPFKNTVMSGYRLTDKVGDYSSVLNTVSAANDQSYGLNIGARFFFGRKNAPPISISSVELVPPATCGLCDAAIVLHGLPAGKTATVNYKKDDTTMPAYTGVVDENGLLKIPGLCSGSYTDINAAVGKKTATAGAPVTIANPSITVSVNQANPTASETCDGNIALNGLNTVGKPVTVNYSYDGIPQAYYGYVGPDNAVEITNLCPGTYTNMTVSTENCAANVTDVTLTAPAPPPPPVPVPPMSEPEENVVDISTPIQFEINKAVLHKSSYPIIEKAATELKMHKDSYIQIDGHCDTTGPVWFNNTLSLKRANAVKTALIKKGADPKRLKAVGHGSRQPAYSNSTREGRIKNRRAVMTMKPL